MQLLGHSLGGSVEPAHDREYGPARARIVDKTHPMFRGVPEEIDVWMSHGDVVAEVPPGLRPLARTQSSMAAMGNDNGVVAVQFHPEVRHTTHGRRLLYNFAVDMCGCRGDWVPASIIDERVTADPPPGWQRPRHLRPQRRRRQRRHRRAHLPRGR